MLKLRNLVIVSCFVAFSTMAAEISLSGTVKDGAGATITGAIVGLASDSTMKDTTTATGEFIITNTTAISGRPYGIAVNKSTSIGIQGNQLRFSINSPATNGMVSIFGSDGRKNTVLPLGKLGIGLHTYTLPDMAAGFFLMSITIDRSATTCRLLNTGDKIFLSDYTSDENSKSLMSRNASAGNVDTLVVKKEGFPTLKKPITSYKQTGIAIVLEQGAVYAYSAAVENTCSDCKVAELPDGKTLTAKNAKLPDPFKKIDGTRITKKSDWRCRRQEILKQAEKYIYGDKPAPPDVVTGTVTNTKITVHVENQGKKIDFSATVKLPSTGQAPYPAIIAVGGGSEITKKGSTQGVAIITWNHLQLGAEGVVEASRGKPNSGLFYDIYGGTHSAGLLMAWAWGASRMIDVLQKSGGAIIDYRRLGVTGCSRTAKGAFAIGLFDERIAVVLSEETSVAGVPAYRIADKLCPENTENNYNGLNWLSNNFGPFVKPKTELLPLDAHELIATFAPRGIFMMENSSSDQTAQQMCAKGGHMAAVGGLKVFMALGCAQNLTYNSNVPANLGHCRYTENFTKSLTENIKKFLLHQPGETGKIEPGSDTLKTTDWIDWTAPTLADDTDLYKTN